MNFIEQISPYLKSNFTLKEKRENVYQLFAPFYHEDGDMVDVFIEPTDKNKIQISDYGMTLMRMSYVYDIDSANKEKIFNKIILSNHLNYSEGKISVTTGYEHFYPALMQFVQTLAKVSSMKLFQREVIQNLFFEQLDEFIQSKLAKYHPEPKYFPIPDATEYEVNYRFNHRPRPLFLFAVNNPSNAKLATISCLKFRNEKIPFRSVVVLENIDVLAKNDLSRLMSVSDKDFPSFNDFRDNAEGFFDRETVEG